MSDYIKREDAIEEICKGCNEQYSKEPCEPSDCGIMQRISDIPSADVVEVVRCKDCVYREVKGEGMTHWFGCRIMEHNDDDWYCSYGERADE